MMAFAQLVSFANGRLPFLTPKGFVSSAASNPDHNTDSNKTGALILALDCMLIESPDYSYEPTVSEVESGSQINDHVTQKPLHLNIEGIVTNTPLPESVAFLKVNSKLLPSPAARAFQILEQMANDRQPFDFIGGFKVYKNMVFTKFQPVRTVKTGQTLQFSATLAQIKTVATDQVQIAKIQTARKKTAGPPVNKGIQISGVAKGVEPTAQTVGDTTFFDAIPVQVFAP